MPIDSSIYAQQQPFRLNTPFETLGQIAQLQQHQQVLQSAKTLDQERQAKLAEDAKKQQEADRFNAIIGNPNLTPENFLEQVRINAPEHYLSTQKSFQEAQKAAEDLKKIKADADQANANVQVKSQEYTANLARQVAAHGNTPEAFELAMKLHEQAFPGSQTPSQLRDYVKQKGPDAIAQLTSALTRSAPQTSEAEDKTQTTAVELPKKQADAVVAQQVAAGTVGGLTPEQQVQKTQGEQRLKLEGLRLSQEDVAPNLTPEAKDIVAHQFAMTGQLPPMGMGKAGAKVRTDIINRSAELYKGLDLPSQQAAFKANQGSLVKMQGQRDAIGSFEETALKNLDQFLATAQKVVDTGSPMINKPLRGISAAVLGTPELAAYNAARQTVIPEFAKILSNPTLAGQLTDSARKEVESLIGPDATLAQAVAVAKILKTDSANRRQSLDDQIAAIQKRIATPPAGVGSTSTTDAKDPMGIRR
jgi:hypothetical protein